MYEFQQESFASMFEALILAILLTYMVLAAVLESFVHPFTVMMTLPLGLVGMAFGLFLTGQTINIFSLMAFIMLVGIVVNNAILLLDYTGVLRSKGKPRREALIARRRGKRIQVGYGGSDDGRGSRFGGLYYVSDPGDLRPPRPRQVIPQQPRTKVVKAAYCPWLMSSGALAL
jgi:hypothetical protein